MYIITYILLYVYYVFYINTYFIYYFLKIMNSPINKKTRILMIAVLYPYLPLSKVTKYYLESYVCYFLAFFSNRVLLLATYFL